MGGPDAPSHLHEGIEAGMFSKRRLVQLLQRLEPPAQENKSFNSSSGC